MEFHREIKTKNLKTIKVNTVDYIYSFILVGR